MMLIALTDHQLKISTWNFTFSKLKNKIFYFFLENILYSFIYLQRKMRATKNSLNPLEIKPPETCKPYLLNPDY